MSIDVQLLLDGSQLAGGIDRNGQLKYFISGTSDPVAARAALAGYVPTSFADVVLQNYNVSPAGPESFYGIATYIPFQGDRPDENEEGTGYSEGLLSATFGGETTKVTQSISTVASYVPGGETATDFHGAINVRQDGEKIEVEGTEQQVPTATFRLTRKYQLGAVGASKLATIASLAKKYNSSTLTISARGIPSMTFAAGTMFFDGAEVTEPNDQDWWTITYILVYQPNITDKEVGDITISSKLGWQYAWILYGKDKDAASKRLTSVPVQANVEEIYESADLNVLFP